MSWHFPESVIGDLESKGLALHGAGIHILLHYLLVRSCNVVNFNASRQRQRTGSFPFSFCKKSFSTSSSNQAHPDVLRVTLGELLLYIIGEWNGLRSLEQV